MNSPHIVMCLYGDENLPQNRMLLVWLCLMKKRKGWSAQNHDGPPPKQRGMMPSAEDAAAASVPSSLTSTTFLATNLDRHKFLPGDIAGKSALPSWKTSTVCKY